jgi:hypothetical protein
MLTNATPKARKSYAEYQGDKRIRLMQTADDIYSSAAHFKLSHEDILNRLSKYYYASKAYKTANRVTRAYVSGYLDALGKAHYKHLEWRVFYRGKLVLSTDIEPNTWHEIDTDKSHHTYIGRPDRVF